MHLRQQPDERTFVERAGGRREGSLSRPKPIGGRATEDPASATLGDLVDAHADWVLRYVRFLVDGDAAAEAVVEQVFLDTWRAMPPGSATEQGALVRLAVAAERRGLAAAAAGHAPIRDAVLALPQRERAVVLLRFAAGLDGPTVRAATGLTTAQLGALQHRALARLSAGLRTAPGQSGGPVSLARAVAV